jgi:hypothetical protein
VLQVTSYETTSVDAIEEGPKEYQALLSEDENGMLVMNVPGLR